MNALAALVSPRKLFAIMIALAVLSAPAVTYAAASTTHHNMQTMEMGHCQMLPSKGGDHRKADGKSCCISMCVAVAIAPAAPSEALELEHAGTYFAAPQWWHGFLGEIATPPPRMA